jgi:hypothetical protein
MDTRYIFFEAKTEFLYIISINFVFKVLTIPIFILCHPPYQCFYTGGPTAAAFP